MYQALQIKKFKAVYYKEEGYCHSDVRGLWYYGDPGSGKSRTAYQDHPLAFRKAQNKWWDGYQQEEVVILDDLDTDTLGHYLKIWGDRYPCQGEIKGGTVQLIHHQFIVTSNYSIQELFKDKDEQLIKAIQRRFKQIHMVVCGQAVLKSPLRLTIQK